jgi:hypothetical protein
VRRECVRHETLRQCQAQSQHHGAHTASLYCGVWLTLLPPCRCSELDAPGVAPNYVYNVAVVHAATLTRDYTFHTTARSLFWDWLCDRDLVARTPAGRFRDPALPLLGSTAAVASLAAVYAKRRESPFFDMDTLQTGAHVLLPTPLQTADWCAWPAASQQASQCTFQPASVSLCPAARLAQSLPLCSTLPRAHALHTSARLAHICTSQSGPSSTGDELPTAFHFHSARCGKCAACSLPADACSACMHRPHRVPCTDLECFAVSQATYLLGGAIQPCLPQAPESFLVGFPGPPTAAQPTSRTWHRGAS